MAVGINRQAVLDELGNPVPQNTGISGYGMPGGVHAPPLTPSPPVPPPAAPAQGMAAYNQRTNASTDPVQKAREMADAAAFDTAQAAPAAAPAGGNFAMRGFDAGKLAGGGDSEKYKIGRVMQRYDPRGGVTPEMLAELNALGIAGFSGGGDKLTVENTKNDPRFGTGGTADVVYGLKGNNADTAWQPWFMDDGGGASGGVTAPQGSAMPTGGNAANPGLQMAQSNLSGLLQGDPYSALQQALGRTQQPNLQALIAQLGGQ